MLFVPTVWLGLPTWVMPLVVTGVAAGLLWWVLAELVDGAAATVGVVVLACLYGFGRLATMYLAQVPVLMLGLAAFAAMLAWRRRGGTWAAALVGLFLGWAAITRPLDAACYGVVVAAGMLGPLLKLPRLAAAKVAAVTVLSAAPFLLVQGAFNFAITGSATRTPFAYYNERDQPALAFAGEGDTSRRPLSTVPQKQWFYDYFTLSFVRAHDGTPAGPLWRDRLNVINAMIAPAVMMLPLAAVGLLGLTTRTRWMLASLLPLFVVAYHFYPIFLFHYVAFALPGVVLLYALAPQVAGRAAGPRWGAMARRSTACVVVGMAIGAAIERAAYGGGDELAVEFEAAREAMARVTPPAVVLFTPPARPRSMHVEFVYNDDVAWPDDAPIIRAHDRGERNAELFDYYAKRSPGRTVWRFDRRTSRATRLGTVGELASGATATNIRPSNSRSKTRDRPRRPHRQFRTMAEANPTDELAFFSLGRAYTDAGRHADAARRSRR
jgi:hypothetical protein